MFVNKNTKGFITKITDGSGHIIALENDGTNLTKITDPTGRSTTYTYSSGLLTRISYPDGTHSDYTYDGDKALVSAQSKSGAKITLGYTSKASGKRVSELQEYGAGGAAGQKLTFDYAEYNTTKIRSGGTDGAFGNSDDLITTLRFDNAGRATGTQVSTAGGVDLGASASILTAASPNDSGSDIETLNRLSRSATIGQYTDNLAKSSGFEAMTGWQSTALGSAAQTAEVSSAEKYIGTSALKLTTTSCSGNAAGRVGQSFTNAVLKPGQTYTASAYVKVPSDIGSNGSNNYGAGIGAIITRTSGGTQNEYSEWVSRQTDTAINNGWRRVSVTFTVPQDATGTQIAMLLYNGTGTAYFDAVQVEEGDAANPYNLLQNSGMELGDGTNWFAVSTTSADGVTAEQAHSGSYSYKVTGDAKTHKYFVQEVPVSGSVHDTYIVSAWAKADAVTDRDEEREFKEDVEIKGKNFELMLNVCFEYSKYVSFLVTETDFQKYSGLESFLVQEEKHMLSEMYDKYLRYSRTGIVKFFYCSNEFKSFILSITKDLWSLIHGWGFENPEDPVFYRNDGSVFFSAVIHEGYGTFYPQRDEDVSAFFKAVDFHTEINTIQIVEDRYQ